MPNQGRKRVFPGLDFPTPATGGLQASKGGTDPGSAAVIAPRSEAGLDQGQLFCGYAILIHPGFEGETGMPVHEVEVGATNAVGEVRTRGLFDQVSDSTAPAGFVFVAQPPACILFVAAWEYSPLRVSAQKVQQVGSVVAPGLIEVLGGTQTQQLRDVSQVIADPYRIFGIKFGIGPPKRVELSLQNCVIWAR